MRGVPVLTGQGGGALVYILVAIALIAALTVTFMQPSTQQTRTQNSFKLAAELNGQAHMIGAAIQDCILRYPEGDATVSPALNGGYHAPYPLEPDSMHLPEAIRAADKDLARLRCPGKPITGQNAAYHAPMFGGSAARFEPVPPALFGPWTYRNGTGLMDEGELTAGVYFRIGTGSSDPYLGEALRKVDEQFAGCESDYLEGDGTNGCAVGHRCLRIWVKRVAPACP
ncbi:MAG: hypothetical protein EBS23_01790 [Betaproteobacteria bacterium]|nr:hypothetical protein [Betaproteobacteria bacterium]